ncbi:MAG: hypothetical protein IT410_03430 [Candidatus Doudnabacteria bacterium]|nr:hypothetical protein [Candidatus Doudnabacteria bacterium]
MSIDVKDTLANKRVQSAGHDVYSEKSTLPGFTLSRSVGGPKPPAMSTIQLRIVITRRQTHQRLLVPMKGNRRSEIISAASTSRPNPVEM